MKFYIELEGAETHATPIKVAETLIEMLEACAFTIPQLEEVEDHLRAYTRRVRSDMRWEREVRMDE